MSTTMVIMLFVVGAVFHKTNNLLSTSTSRHSLNTSTAIVFLMLVTILSTGHQTINDVVSTAFYRSIIIL